MNGEDDDITDDEVVLQEPEGDEPAVEEVDPEVIAEAKKYGWREKDKFDKAPEGWVDAKRYLELPSTETKRIRDEMRELKAGFTRVASVSESAVEIARQQERERYEAKLAEIAQAQRTAVESADVETFDRLEKARTQIIAPQQPVAKFPEVDAYRSKNDWTQDPFLWDTAIKAVQSAIDSGKQFTSAADQIAYGESTIKRLYPHVISPPAQQQTTQRNSFNRVDAGGLAGGGGPQMTAAEMAAAKEFVAQGLFKSVADYQKYAEKLEKGN